MNPVRGMLLQKISKFSRAFPSSVGFEFSPRGEGVVGTSNIIF